eukprot:TRINITY_DN60569_c0_g2_i1.p1 TRINITY_DN60569_c0_g2~~TRINITY_DN60569_c0_g2_i1.p1  ORF type:complete len:724 (-),score=123.21 TRINITY_DN60569_c0_g2_i1:290-2461(-)
MLFRLFLGLCLVVGLRAQNTCISTGQGVNADGCNCNNNCGPYTPAGSSNTILIPSPNGPGQLQAANVFTLVGTDIPAAAGLQLCLAPAGVNSCNPGNLGQCILRTDNPPLTTSATFTIPTTGAGAWATSQMELESTPRRLCLENGGVVRETGLFMAVVWNCDDTVTAQTCATAYRTTVSGAAYTNAVNAQVNPGLGLTALQVRQLQGNTQCCKGGLGFQVGRCINPNLQSCCGGAGIERTTQRCCNSTTQTVAAIGDSCPCVTHDAQLRPIANGNCPFNEFCCVKTKYPELLYIGQSPVRQTGTCFNPATHQCCNTGEVYDSGSHQCCSINGVQSLNIPCPCEAHSDCVGGNAQAFNLSTTNNRQALTDMMCCKQTSPPPRETAVCDAYTNFPSGQASPESQRCHGVCFDTRYQICCNGAVCRREFEKCCNATCCNRRIGTCADYGRRSPALSTAYNWVGFGDDFKQCTIIEQLDPIKVFWIFIMPTLFGLGTLVAVAVVLVFTSRARRRVFVFVEKLLIILALVIVLFSIVTYFSPAYKFGIVLSIAAMLSILTAAAGRVKWLNVLAVVAIVIAILYMFDPFSGNDYLNMTYLRMANNYPHPNADGFFRTVDLLWQDGGDEVARACVDWYQYFAYDRQLRDLDRYDNPFTWTFGYCSRGYLAALMYFGILAAALLVAMLVLALIMLILRFRKEHYDPVEIVTQIHDDAGMPFPGALDDDYFD